MIEQKGKVVVAMGTQPGAAERRSWRTWAAPFLGLLLLPIATASTANAAVAAKGDWAKFQFDLGNSGFNRFESTINAGNVGHLKQAWSVQTDTANPAQAGDVVYQGARAIDAATGNVLWDRSSIFGFSVVDAVSGGAVYLARESGGLVALDAVSGHVRWEANGPGTLLASPTVVGGLVYGMDSNGIVSAYPTACSTPCDPVWTIDLGNDQESLAYADGTIYAVSNGAVKNTGTLYALDATTGHVVWSTTQVGLADTAPVVVRGIVYAGEGRLSTGYSIAAYPASCSTPCQAILRIPVTGAIGSFAVAHGSIYATVGGTSLYAFDATSGATLWHGSIGTQGGSPGYPAVANGVVYKTGNDGHLYAFDAASGANLLALDIQHCETSCGGSFYATPAISQGSVYVRGGDGVLHALRLSSAR